MNSYLKTAVWLAGACLVLVVMLYPYINNVQAQSPPPRPRFEKISAENLGPETGYWNFYAAFDVFHDKETGNEIVCVTKAGTGRFSCFETGRSWK